MPATETCAPISTTGPKRRQRRGVMLFFAALLAVASASGAHAETLKVGGTGAALGTMQLLGNAFTRHHPTIKIEVLPYIGSTGAIKGINAGSLDLGLSGRTAKPAEQTLDARLQRYAMTPLVIATHPENPLRAIKPAELAAIYSGQLTRWNDGGLIRIILRPAQETDNEVLRSISPAISQGVDSALARPGMRFAATDQDAADMIERVPGAIGTATLALILSEKRPLRILALDGVMPSLETLKSGRYAFNKPLFLVTRLKPKPAVQSFVDFIQSPRGQAILMANGQLPMSP